MGIDLDEVTARSWIGRTLVDLYRDLPDPEAMRRAAWTSTWPTSRPCRRAFGGVATVDELASLLLS